MPPIGATSDATPVLSAEASNCSCSLTSIACKTDDPVTRNSLRGEITSTFGGDVTMIECRHIVDAMRADKIGTLVEAGVPLGLPVAHKHGWSNDTHGDAALLALMARFAADGGLLDRRTRNDETGDAPAPPSNPATWGY